MLNYFLCLRTFTADICLTGIGCYIPRGGSSSEKHWAFKLCEGREPPLLQLNGDISKFLVVRKDRLDVKKLHWDRSGDEDCVWFEVSLKEPSNNPPNTTCNDQKSSGELFQLWLFYCSSLKKDDAGIDHRFCRNGVMHYEQDNYGTVVMGSTGVVLLLAVAVALFARWKYQTGLKKFMIFYTVVMSFMDFSSDVVFVLRCFSPMEYNAIYRPVKITALFFLVLPVVVNIPVVMWFIFQIAKEETTGVVMEANVLSTFAVGLLSIINPELLNFFNSKVFGKAIVNLELQASIEDKLKYVGLLTNVLEDIPQFGMQAYVIAVSGNYDTMTLISMISSSLSLVIGILGRLIKFIFVVTKSSRKKTEEEFTELELE